MRKKVGSKIIVDDETDARLEGLATKTEWIMAAVLQEVFECGYNAGRKAERLGVK